MCHRASSLWIQPSPPRYIVKNMPENDGLWKWNDFLSRDQPSQDWPSSMHDHTSNPFNVFISETAKLLYRHSSLFSRSILKPTKSLRGHFHVCRQSCFNRGSTSPVSQYEMNAIHRHGLLWNIGQYRESVTCLPFPSPPLKHNLWYGSNKV